MASDADLPLRTHDGLQQFEETVDIDPADPLAYETWKMVQAYGRGGSYTNPQVEQEMLYPSAVVDHDHEIKAAFRDEARRQLREFYAAQLSAVTNEELPVQQAVEPIEAPGEYSPVHSPEQAAQITAVTADYLEDDPVVAALADETAEHVLPPDDEALQLRDEQDDFVVDYLAPR